ncbi:hypothetical protein [Actinomadura sp. NTSP31]|uniref:hypothetical protein n=1 Tax=Actinomadura sp. NTSP31 TaxID=1735447 RepID=UPI0035C0A5F6
MWAEYLQAEIDSVANFVHQAESEFRDSVEEASRRPPQHFEQEIEGGLGTVRVNGFGFLVDVTLTSQNLHSYRGKVLAERIVRAVSAAAETAARAQQNAAR